MRLKTKFSYRKTNLKNIYEIPGKETLIGWSRNLMSEGKETLIGWSRNLMSKGKETLHNNRDNNRVYNKGDIFKRNLKEKKRRGERE